MRKAISINIEIAFLLWNKAYVSVLNMVYIKIDALQVLCLSFITLTNIDIKIPPKIHWNFRGFLVYII